MAQKQKIELELGEFKPFAYYDQYLDCIRVYTHDRSVTEQRLDDVITIFRCNHKSDTDPEYVGFSLKGIRHMLDEVGLPMDRAYSLAEIFDVLVKKLPGQLNKAILDVTLHSHSSNEAYNDNIQVDFAAAA